MNTRTRRLASFTLLLLACFAFACNLDETEEANKLIDAGNAAITEAEKYWEEANSKTHEIFDSLSPEEYLEKRDSLKSTAQQAVASFEKSAAKCREASAKFDQASKLKVQEKLREYLIAKSQEWAKYAERADVAKESPKAFMESSDAITFSKKNNEINERIARLEREASELAEKSNKIHRENKNIFLLDSR